MVSEPKFKKGDWLYHTTYNTDYWKKGKVFQFEKCDDDYLYELNGGGANTYTSYCRLATQDEIPKEHRKDLLQNLVIW